ncbi:MAG: aspartate/glutamate racemase family protein [Oscillospiraceae bacterium]|nr:aspartate/glutamate racemase family protein [Oscillospiraceae bacterium]
MIEILHKMKADTNAKHVVRIGILGGMGVGATNQFYKLLEESIPEELKGNLDIHMVNDPVVGMIDEIPDRSRYIEGEWPETPAFEMSKRAYFLEKQDVDFIVMPCNTAHYFLPEMQRGLYFNEFDKETGEFIGHILYKVTTPFVHIQKETLDFIQQEHPDIKKVGVLATTGTVKGGQGLNPIFSSVFEPAGLEVIYPTNDDNVHAQDDVMEGIRAVKKADLMGDGEEKQLKLAEAKELVMVGVEDLLNKRSEAIVGGCTEIPLVISQEDVPESIPVIDTIEVLVNATIREANELLKEKREQVLTFNDSIRYDVSGAGNVAAQQTRAARVIIL